jgi:hypothetical protein
MKRSPIKHKPRKKQTRHNKEFLAFVKTLPCFACYKEIYARFRDYPDGLLELIDIQPSFGLQHSVTEAAHVGRLTSKRGIGQKYPDNESAPLCAKEHHREGLESIHVMGPDVFFPHHEIDRDGMIDQIQSLFVASGK